MTLSIRVTFLVVSHVIKVSLPHTPFSMASNSGNSFQGMKNSTCFMTSVNTIELTIQKLFKPQLLLQFCNCKSRWISFVYRVYNERITRVGRDVHNIALTLFLSSTLISTFQVWLWIWSDDVSFSYFKFFFRSDWLIFCLNAIISKSSLRRFNTWVLRFINSDHRVFDFVGNTH